MRRDSPEKPAPERRAGSRDQKESSNGYSNNKLQEQREIIKMKRIKPKRLTGLPVSLKELQEESLGLAFVMPSVFSQRGA
jgi:hypothetical protein